MEVAFEYLQVRAAGSETMLRGEFDAQGQLQVSGSLEMTYDNVESVIQAGKIVYDFALTNFPNEFEWWGVEYFYTSVALSSPLAIREMRSGDEFLFIFGDDLPDDDLAADRFLYSLNGSGLCQRVEWFLGGYQVGLSETALAQDRSELHLNLLSLYA